MGNMKSKTKYPKEQNKPVNAKSAIKITYNAKT